jgi:hypothetical protein
MTYSGGVPGELVACVVCLGDFQPGVVGQGALPAVAGAIGCATSVLDACQAGLCVGLFVGIAEFFGSD